MKILQTIKDMKNRIKKKNSLLRAFIITLATLAFASCGNDDDLVGTKWYAEVVQVWKYADSTNVSTFIDAFHFISDNDFTYSWQENVHRYKADTLFDSESKTAEYHSSTYTFSDNEGKVKMWGEDYDFSIADDILIFQNTAGAIKLGKNRTIKNDTMYMN
jgi:hypothetical protein